MKRIITFVTLFLLSHTQTQKLNASGVLEGLGDTVYVRAATNSVYLTLNENNVTVWKMLWPTWVDNYSSTILTLEDSVSGKCLQLENGNASNEIHLKLADCDRANKAQRFRFSLISSQQSSFRVISEVDGRFCLDSAGGQTGNPLKIWRCHPDNHEHAYRQRVLITFVSSSSNDPALSMSFLVESK